MIVYDFKIASHIQMWSMEGDPEKIHLVERSTRVKSSPKKQAGVKHISQTPKLNGPIISSIGKNISVNKTLIEVRLCGFLLSDRSWESLG
jgi:hypothetical protein